MAPRRVAVLFLALLCVGIPSVVLPSAAAATSVDWVKQDPATKPGPRASPGMASDFGAGQVVMYGGYLVNGTGTQFLSDTWTWDGSNWTSRCTACGPGLVEVAANEQTPMAYDPHTDRVVLWVSTTAAGPGQVQLDQATWVWDGSTWSEACSDCFGPGNCLDQAEMAYDPNLGKLIMAGFFGTRAGGCPQNPEYKTFAWNGSSWTDVSPPNSPCPQGVSPCGGIAMATDDSTGRVILYATTGVWEWNGLAWTEQTASAPSPFRYATAMAEDPLRSSVVLMGGSTNPNSNATEAATWLWDGSTWAASTGAGPGTREAEGLADGFGSSGPPNLQEGVLFGGRDGQGNFLNDTWMLASSALECTIHPGTLRYGVVDHRYRTTLSATGGTAPYSFTVTSGSLPPGLHLADGGLLSGTPTARGSFGFHVTVTDAQGCTGERSYSMRVYVVPPPVLDKLRTLNRTLEGAIVGTANGSLTWDQIRRDAVDAINLKGAALNAGFPDVYGVPYVKTGRLLDCMDAWFAWAKWRASFPVLARSNLRDAVVGAFKDARECGDELEQVLNGAAGVPSSVFQGLRVLQRDISTAIVKTGDGTWDRQTIEQQALHLVEVKRGVYEPFPKVFGLSYGATHPYIGNIDSYLFLVGYASGRPFARDRDETVFWLRKAKSNKDALETKLQKLND
jgi:Putative Ig domain